MDKATTTSIDTISRTCIAVRLRLLNRVVTNFYDDALRPLGLKVSQLNILIRSAVCKAGRTYFHVGAGIVADSIPSAEYDETMAKAGGFVAALQSATDRLPLSLGERG